MSKNTQLGNLVNGVYVDSSGKVGIGTQSPFAQLTIQNISSNVGGVNFGEATDTASRRWQLRNDTDVFGDFGIRQSTTQSGSTYVNRLYISSIGNIGVGTASPSNITGYTTISLNNTTNGSIYETMINGVVQGRFYSNSSSTGIGSVSNNPLLFITNDTERMRITSAGSVGIGTTSPINTLHINAANDITDSFGQLYVSTNNTATQNFGGQITLGGYFNGTTNQTAFAAIAGRKESAANGSSLGYLSFATQSGAVTERMRITSGGNVGIGASISPTYLLEVSAAGGSQRIRVGTLQNNNNTSTFEAITTQTNTTASSGWFRANAGGTMSIGTSSYTKTGGDSGNFANLSAESQTTAMTLKANGDIQIGAQDSTVTTRVAISFDAAYPNDVSPSHLSLCGISDSRKRMSLGYDTVNNYGWINSGQWGVQWTNLYMQKSGGALYGGSARLDNNSDIRIKDNIQPITGALNKVLSMNGKKFHMLDEPGEKIRLGFIAQELQGVVDELVIESDRKQTLPNGDIVENILGLETWGSSWAALLVEAIKELSAEIETLKNK